MVVRGSSLVNLAWPSFTRCRRQHKICRPGLQTGHSEASHIPSPRSGRQNRSVPQISIIEINSMSAQQEDELRLKSHAPVVFLLSFDVPCDTRYVRAADAESTESALPCKCPVFRNCVMDPLRRTTLQLSHCFRNRDRRRQDHQRMNVVYYRVGDEDCPAELAGDATKVRQKPRLYVRRDEWLSPLGRERDVREQRSVCTHGYCDP
jgi:hypothetical protein